MIKYIIYKGISLSLPIACIIFIVYSIITWDIFKTFNIYAFLTIFGFIILLVFIACISTFFDYLSEGKLEQQNNIKESK
jgi:hypothetical protein